MIPELAELSGLSPCAVEHKEDGHCEAVSAETWTDATLTLAFEGNENNHGHEGYPC